MSFAGLSDANWRARLLAEPPDMPQRPRQSDHFIIEPGPDTVLQPAAVLLPIIDRPEPAVLFTRRSNDLPRHAGQISFPGGRAHPGDASLAATALREMQEETGIDPDFVTVEGYLSVYEIGTGYAILPVVGRVREGFALAPCASEVAEIFEAPLAFFLDPVNCREESREFAGRLRRFYAFQYGPHYIWGATAAMLVDLAQRLSP